MQTIPENSLLTVVHKPIRRFCAIKKTGLRCGGRERKKRKYPALFCALLYSINILVKDKSLIFRVCSNQQNIIVPQKLNLTIVYLQKFCFFAKIFGGMP